MKEDEEEKNSIARQTLAWSSACGMNSKKDRPNETTSTYGHIEWKTSEDRQISILHRNDGQTIVVV